MNQRLLQTCIFIAAGGASAVSAGPEFDYLLHCGGCHLEDGAGDPPLVPDLRSSLGTLSTTPEGRAYIAQVPGSAQAPLNDVELASVLNWMLARYVSGTASEPFTPNEIAGYRGFTLMDPVKRRSQLLNSPAD